MIAFFLFVQLVLAQDLVQGAKRSGFYTDNGLDQTEIDLSISNDEKKDMELEILSLLGLPDRPRKINGSHIKKAAPQFLLDIYKSLMEKENDENDRAKRSNDLNLSGEEKNAIDESDMIMTIESMSHHVSNVRHERGKRLWFNVSDVPIAENIVGAELRIYKQFKEKKSPTQYTVTAYQIVKTDSGEKDLEYVSAVNTTSEYTGWLDLNMTSSLSTWVAFPDANKGLYLSVHPTNKPGHEVRPEDIGLVTVKGEDEAQPFMVAFLKAMNAVKVRRSVRSTNKRVKKSDYTSIMRNPAGYGEMSAQHESLKSCKIHNLYISFKDINWRDWIIAPDGYAAYYCAGECNFPLNAHMNATNHAIVQTLVHLMQPLRYPKPCCAPTKLTPISVLYFLDDSNVILKKFKRMVVKSCGCH